MRRRLGTAVVLLVLLHAGGRAGATVLETITIDGNMSDWSEVLTDVSQNAADGNPDLDAPVPSVGRDLVRFAWTYDARYLYFYVGRSGSDNNRQRFWFYLDTNNDLLMETGEPVVCVSWWGSSRRTDIELWTYRAASPGGDSLGGPSGSADGWDMPGTVSLVQYVEGLSGGSPSGIQMESRVEWSRLGIAAGTPVRFHVSASASTNLPAQVQDNMGGPDGGIGYIGIAAIRLDPDQWGTIVPAGSCALAHRAWNDGAGPDLLNLTATASGSFVPSRLEWHRDADGDGQLDATDPLLSDGDGDGLPDTGLLPPGGFMDLLLVAAAPAGLANGQTSTITALARSDAMPAVLDRATDTLTVAIPRLTLVKSADRGSAAPGDVISYSVIYTSNGATPAYAVVVVDPVPLQSIYVAGSATGAGTAISFSHDGGLTFDASEAAPVTHIRWSLAASLPPGGSGTVGFRAQVR